MTAINANSNPFINPAETEVLIEKKSKSSKGLKICLATTACIYALAIGALIGVAVEQSKYDCSGMKDNALLHCQKIEQNLNTAKVCLIGVVAVPIICCIGICICAFSKPGDCNGVQLLV